MGYSNFGLHWILGFIGFWAPPKIITFRNNDPVKAQIKLYDLKRLSY